MRKASEKENIKRKRRLLSTGEEEKRRKKTKFKEQRKIRPLGHVKVGEGKIGRPPDRGLGLGNGKAIS